MGSTSARSVFISREGLIMPGDKRSMQPKGLTPSAQRFPFAGVAVWQRSHSENSEGLNDRKGRGG